MKLRKLLHPLYVIYQVCFAWWAALLLVTLASIVIMIFGGYFKIKGADHWPAVIWCRLTCWVFLIPVKVVDREKYVEKGKNYIFAANHQGMFDIFIMYGYVAKRFKWFMKDTLRKVPLLGKACAMTDHIYVNRTTPQKDIFRKAIKIIKNGDSIGIFPEGTRCKNGKLGRFKKGAFVVANMTQAPVIPVSIQGSYDIMPVGGYFFHWSPVILTFHAPIVGESRGSENVEYLMEKSREAIARTLGEE